jgi:tRNA A-37 threonylcarbamoyl transferase component Bud32
MQKLDREQLENYISANQILYGTTERPGLMLTPDGEVVKFFYRRKKISTGTFLPQAQRFTTNSRKLLERDIPAPLVKDLIYCNEIPVHMVVYDRIEGKDLRELCQTDGVNGLAHLPDYFAHLHKKGIYFRAVHLGNILIHADEISLLDISDLTTQSSPLGIFQRARNLAHLFNTEHDKAYFVTYGLDRFVQEYVASCQFSTAGKWLFLKRLGLALDDDMFHALIKHQE